MPRRKMSVTQLTASNFPKHDGGRHHHAPGKIGRDRRHFNAFMDCHCPRLGSSGVRFRSMRHAVKKNGRIGRLCKVCVWRTRRFSRQLFLCNLARLRQHCHLSGCSELRSELVPSAIFFSICLYRLRTPFMDRIASHFPLALHHGPHYRYLRLGSPTALDYACYCRRLLV